MKGVPERSADVGKRVDTQTIGTRFFDPPDCILRQILRDIRVFLVHVGQCVGKPAFENILLIAPGCVRVDEWFEVTDGGVVVL